MKSPCKQVAIISVEIDGVFLLGKRLFAAELSPRTDEQLETDGVTFFPNETLRVDIVRSGEIQLWCLVQNSAQLRTGNIDEIKLQVRKRSMLYRI